MRHLLLQEGEIIKEGAFTKMVGSRIRLARHELHMPQHTLSSKMGFKNRQTISYIEKGERKVTAEELLKFSKHLKKEIDYFTDQCLCPEAQISIRIAAEEE